MLNQTTPLTVTELDRCYYYRPLAFDGGATLKCAGFGAEDAAHKKFYLPYFATNEAKDARFLPGVVILVGYHGDKITREYADEFATHIA